MSVGRLLANSIIVCVEILGEREIDAFSRVVDNNKEEGDTPYLSLMGEIFVLELY